MSAVPPSPAADLPGAPTDVRWGSEPPEGCAPCVVTIGVFDGVHLGHRVVVGRAAELARSFGLPCVALTFDPHPSEVVGRGDPVVRLSTVEHRARLLGAAGADAVWVLPFTRELSQESPEQFVEQVLVSRLRPRAVVIGANFRFGHRAAGDAGTLRELGERFGFAVEAVTLASGGHEPEWSSTAVRAHLAEGDVAAAGRVLGRLHRVEGTVVHGDHRGRELGYPTANLGADPRAAVPDDGVYAGWLVRAGGERLPAAVSVGTNPTFDGQQRRVEAYVLGRTDLDLYGERVAVEFAERLRGMERFGSVDELVAQMAADVSAARAVLGAVRG